MAEMHRQGAAYWIDHYVVPVTDLDRWSQFYTNVLGAEPRQLGGGEREERRAAMLFTFVGPRCHVGGSVHDQPLGATKEPGEALPRYGWFVRPEEIAEHLRRLDRYGVAHTDPIRTSEQGEEGTAIRFEDPDHNPIEFWAPARMPAGAMAGESQLKVGRMASATFECRDLTKAADFYTEFCGLDVARGADVASDSVVLPLAGAGRLVFKKVDTLGTRTGGHMIYRALHTALILRDDEFMGVYDRMWEGLPEWDYDPAVSPRVPVQETESLPARTGLHGSPQGPEWKRVFGRGDSFYDWDTNAYHFVPAAPVDGSMAVPRPASARSFVEQRKAATG